MQLKIEIKSDIRLQHLLNTERKIWTINVEICDLGQKLEHWNNAVSSTLKDCKNNAGNRGLSRSALCWEVTVLTDSTLSQCPWAQNSDCHIQKDNQDCPLNSSSHAFSVFSYLCFVFVPTCQNCLSIKATNEIWSELHNDNILNCNYTARTKLELHNDNLDS